MFYKVDVIKTFENSEEILCAEVFCLIKLQDFSPEALLKKAYACEFCELFKNAFFTEQPDDCFC